MRRLVWNVFCIVSFLVLVIGVVIWIRGYRAPADFEWFSRHTDSGHDPPVTYTLGCGVAWGPGAIGVFHYHGESSTPAQEAATWIYREFPPTRTLLAAPEPQDRLNFRLGHFQLLHRVEPRSDGWQAVRIMSVPMWLTLVAMIPPLMWLRRRFQGNSSQPNLSD